MISENNVKPHSIYLKSLGKKFKEMTAEEQSEYFRLRRTTTDTRAADRRYYHTNAEVIREKKKRWYKEDPERYKKHYDKFMSVTTNKLACRWFKWTIQRNAVTGSFKEVIGCTPEELKVHIESQFIDGMSWDNWGIGKGRTMWHVDHIKALNNGGSHHYTNLQPLWALDNRLKSCN